MLDFPSAQDAAFFVENLRRHNQIPKDAGAYECESLDFSPGQGGIGRSETYVVLRTPEGTTRKRLAITSTREV
jgi:hypothetical protein